MRFNGLVIFCLSILVSGFSCSESREALLRYEGVGFRFDPRTGYGEILDLNRGETVADSIAFRINEHFSHTAGRIRKVNRPHALPEEYETVTWECRWNGLTACLTYGISRRDHSLAAAAEVLNTGAVPAQVYRIEPFSGARLLYSQNDAFESGYLEGNGGGEATHLLKKPAVCSRNNVTAFFSSEQETRSVVAGGLTYHDYEKFVRVDRGKSREKLISERENLLAYLNLGFDRQDGYREMLRQGTGEPYRHTGSPYREEVARGVYGWNFVLAEALNLDPEKSYYIGLTWLDVYNGRSQSVFADNGKDPLPDHFRAFKPLAGPELPASMVLLGAGIRMPQAGREEASYPLYFQLPPSVYRDSLCRIIVKHNDGGYATLSELWLCEGEIPASPDPLSAFRPEGNPPAYLSVYGYDEVGRRTDPGESYLSPDLYYFSFYRDSPFDAAEQYARKIQALQDIRLPVYTFPTVCMWYAYEPLYGQSGLDGTSRACIKEMENIRRSGFMNYSPVGIRLVPVSLGWFDDAHTLYGTYAEPYETTRKWGDAIRKRGGIPFYYFTNVRIPDEENSFAEAYPGSMLFNHSQAPVPCFDFMMNGVAGYDYTDSAFVRHLRESVYPPLRSAGVRGAMWDFPYSQWPSFGGMEDRYSTAASAYRRVFEIARDGLGEDAFLQERNLDRGADVTAGLCASQRTWGDTDILTPEMVWRTALRWYKNRVVYQYDADAKNLLRATPANRDGIRKMLTMSYVAGSRLLMANSFAQLTPEMVYDLSRIFPFDESGVSFRPVDLFVSGGRPAVFHRKADDDRHQVVLYNSDDGNPFHCRVPLGEASHRGGLELDPDSEYYVYDFWNDTPAGVYGGGEMLEQVLRPGEARVLSIRKRTGHPQLLSTDRHILQGLLEPDLFRIENNRICGMIRMPAGEETTLVFAANNRKIKSASDESGNPLPLSVSGEIVRLVIPAGDARNVYWNVSLD